MCNWFLDLCILFNDLLEILYLNDLFSKYTEIGFVWENKLLIFLRYLELNIGRKFSIRLTGT